MTPKMNIMTMTMTMKIMSTMEKRPLQALAATAISMPESSKCFSSESLLSARNTHNLLTDIALTRTPHLRDGVTKSIAITMFLCASVYFSQCLLWVHQVGRLKPPNSNFH